MRRVHANKDGVAHYWAHQIAEWGRDGRDSFSFREERLFSYATEIGRIIRHKGRTAYVLDTSSWTSTTSKHQIAARRAIPKTEKIFCVEDSVTTWERSGTYTKFGRTMNRLSTPQGLRDFYLNCYRSEPEHSRYKHIRAQRRVTQIAYLELAIEVCEYFKLGHKKLAAELERIKPERQEALQIVQDDRFKKMRRRIKVIRKDDQ